MKKIIDELKDKIKIGNLSEVYKLLMDSGINKYLENMLAKCKVAKLLDEEYEDYINALITWINVLTSLGNFNQVQKLINNSLICSEIKNDMWLTATLYDRLGVIKKRHGQYELALKYYYNALDIALKNKYFETNTLGLNLVADTYLNIGNIYRDAEKDYKKAIKMYNEAFEHMKKYEHKSGFGRYHLDMGLAYSYDNNEIVAIEYYKKAEGVFKNLLLELEDLDTIHQLARVYNNAAWSYRTLNNFNKARQCYLKAIPLYEKVSDFEFVRKATYYLNQLPH